MWKKRREMAQSGEIIPDLMGNNSVCPGGVPGVLSLGLAGSAEGGLIPKGFFPMKFLANGDQCPQKALEAPGKSHVDTPNT